MLALRSHYELGLQYLYFKDHPKELKSLLDLRSQNFYHSGEEVFERLLAKF